MPVAKAETRKVGFLSGTFDPIHEGHIVFAETALKQMGLEKVFFLVEPRPRRKQGVKALEHRQNMVHLAIEDKPVLGQIILNQTSFTVRDTLPTLQALYKGAEIYFLMGDDTLTYFTDVAWPEIDHFIQSVGLVIGARQRTINDIKRHLRLIEKTRKLKINYQLLKTTAAIQNSTTIRNQLRKGQHPKEVNPAVFAYIQLHGLYAPSEEA